MNSNLKKILIVEDESKMREFIALYLRQAGYEVIEAEDGEMALEKFETDKVNLVILDIMMPKLNGFEVCKSIRANSDVPIIILTAMAGETEHVEGYELGADDYMTKPFKGKILVAKVKRLLERYASPIEEKVYKYKALKIDWNGRGVFIEGQIINLAPKEYELLAYLVLNQSIALTRDQILENVWGYDFQGDSRVVDNHIKKLRHKLGDYSNCIETVISVGYKFVETGHEI